MPYAFLGDDMGLGKTLSVLSYYSALRATKEFKLLLVVCPNSLARNWAREAKMWFPGLRVSVLAGDKGEKAWMLRMLTQGAADADLLIVNYEGVRLEYVTPELEKLVTSRRTLLCLDESQRVKNPSAKTFKAISQLAPCCDRRVLLSGTPTPKDVSDLWAQMRILDGGERFGRSYYKWLSRVAELGTEYSQYAVKKFHDAEVAESIHRAHEIMLRRRKERVVNLPPKTFSIREIELTGSQAERYNEIREGLMLRMRSLSGEQFVREITNILEEYLRAVQVSSNPRLIDPEWKGEPAKFLELDEIVREIVHEQGQKIVVWTNYLGNRESTVRAFQESDKPKILVAVPAAGGVGITLTAAQTAVYVDKTWNAEHWMQSVDRIHRIGQRGTVNVISLLGCKVDEIIHWNLRRKEQGQARVLGDYETPGDNLKLGISREELLDALS
jgi:SNF2 family DNA or RNA helicase